MIDRSHVFKLAVVLVAGLTAVSCSGDTDVPDVAEVSTTVEEVTERFVRSDVERVWSQAWLAAGKSDSNKAAALEDISSSVSDVALEELDDSWQFGSDDDRMVTNYPSIVENDDGTLTINDCMLWSTTDTTGMSKWWEGQLSLNEEDEWVIDSLELIKRDGCIPKEINDQILEDYAEALEAETQFWNPADPGHPGIEKTIAEPRLNDIRELVAEDEERGFYLQTDPESHPEIFQILSPRFVKIRDCQVNDEKGLFDSEGKRQEGVAERRPGQRSIDDVTMKFIDGQWKVGDVQSQNDWDCDFAPTDAGLPIV